MNIRKEAKERTAELGRIILAAKKSLAVAPEGFLQLSKSHGTDQYYHVIGNNVSRKYLGKKDLALAGKLAQKAYDEKVLRLAEQELAAWNMLAKLFPEMTVEEVFESLSPARQKLVTPIRLSDEVYRKQWEAVEYEPGEFKPNQPRFATDRGEYVRSKSEQLIANMLFRLGIPYRYEYPLEISVNGRVRKWRPDFTILDVRNRCELYLEHFGMLDDQSGEDNYAVTAFWKMKIYEENGYYPGKQMLFSFETSKAPLDIVYVEMMVRRALGMPPVRRSRPERSY